MMADRKAEEVSMNGGNVSGEQTKKK